MKLNREKLNEILLQIFITVLAILLVSGLQDLYL